jgi:hypothetical protein
MKEQESRMRRTKTDRILAMLFLGVLTGVYLNVRAVRWIEIGRDAYMAVQSEHYQRLLNYHSLLLMMIWGVVLVGAAVGLYEMLAAGIAHVLPQRGVGE